MGTRKPKAVAEAAPDVDTQTLDLLADVAPANDPAAKAGGEIAPAAAAEVGALALVTLSPEKYVATVYQPFKERLVSAIDSVRTVAYDITTPAGMKQAIECRAKFRDLRVEADKERKVRKEPINRVGKLLESGFDGIEERIAPIEQMFDFDIQVETKRRETEKAEKDRIEAARLDKIKSMIDDIRDLPVDYAAATSEKINICLAGLAMRELSADDFAEFLGEATVAVDTVAAALIVLRDAALAREQAAAEALRLQAEEKQRLADQAEANRVEQERLEAARIEAARVAAETKRQLDEQAAQVAAARKAQELAAAALLADQQRQQQAMTDIRSIQQLGELLGTRAVLDAITTIKGMELATEKFGAMLDLATMTRDMTLVKLEQRLAGYLSTDLPLAHEKALIDNAQFDYDRAPQPAVAVMEHAPAIDWEVPATLPLPESCTEHDAMIDAGAISEGPDDMQIVDLVASEYGLTRSEAIVRLAQIDFKALEES